VNRRLQCLLCLCLSLLLAACLAPRGDNPAEKRAAIQTMKSDTLSELYRQRPSARDNIARADGYAVFSNVSAHFFWLGGSGGYGVAADSQTGRQVYMKMAQVGVGLGLGVQDVRVVFVFHSRQALQNFIDQGWEFGAQADAAAKAKDKGGAATGEVSISTEIDVYTLSAAGLLVKANLAGTKYWQDAALNQ